MRLHLCNPVNTVCRSLSCSCGSVHEFPNSFPNLGSVYLAHLPHRTLVRSLSIIFHNSCPCTVSLFFFSLILIAKPVCNQANPLHPQLLRTCADPSCCFTATWFHVAASKNGICASLAYGLQVFCMSLRKDSVLDTLLQVSFTSCISLGNHSALLALSLSASTVCFICLVVAFSVGFHLVLHLSSAFSVTCGSTYLPTNCLPRPIPFSILLNA